MTAILRPSQQSDEEDHSPISHLDFWHLQYNYTNHVEAKTLRPPATSISMGALKCLIVIEQTHWTFLNKFPQLHSFVPAVEPMPAHRTLGAGGHLIELH